MDAQEVSLQRELDYLQLYLAIEQVRFQDRLRVQLFIDPVAHEALVPQLILQPIVENAVRHGIGRSSTAGRILISASKIDGVVALRVQDDGPGLSSSDMANDRGIGLANTRARLQQLYGQNARLEIGNCEERGVVVTMTIPFHRSHGET
jgi:sensor histidine kinase YesM